MKLTSLRVNHFDTFMGHRSDPLVLSWTVSESTGQTLTASRVEIAADAAMTDILFDSGWAELDPLSYEPAFSLSPRTQYFWRVSGQADDGDTGTSAVMSFETGKRDEAWSAQWITSPFDKELHFYAAADFNAADVVKARAYVACHGVYELYLNGEKVDEEYLAPGYHSYDFRDMAYTYDLTPYLKENNRIGAMVAPGWFKGRFGLRGHSPKQVDQYGDTMEFLCEVHLTMADGTEQVIITDENWLCHISPVTMSNIYDGEDYDARLEVENWCSPECDGTGWQPAVLATPISLTLKTQVPVIDRTNPPIRVVETMKATLIDTPEGDRILDFGQVITGWMEADVDVPEGTEVTFAVAEVLEHGNWYRANLRSARAELHYISAGKPAHVRPHGTFFGFRYIKVTGMDPDPEKIIAHVMHSDLARTGWIETDNELVNKLISNAYWGQRDNFLDVPTDCPQRDERMGWTGDTQVFSGTACFNQYTAPFYAKYMEDLTLEQTMLGGAVPGYIPLATAKGMDGVWIFVSCGWGDVSTVVPWHVYNHYGDKVQLARDYPAMKAYVDYLYQEDEKDFGKRLWQTGSHTADWLALDNYKNPHAPNGGTDEYFLASAYYAHSSRLVARAAAALGYEWDAEYYENLSQEVRAAILDEYFTPNGRCVCDTQTAYLIALQFDLVPEIMRPRLTELLREKLYEDKYHLQTGFLGTPLLCPALSDNGYNDLAYTILLNEEYPGWLHEVKLGATTLWERWNSVMPDGTINRNGMSSMNHYSYGAIVEWIYRYACGLYDAEPGWKHATLKPLANAQLGKAKARYESASGTWECGWSIDGESITYQVTVPFNCTADLSLPGQEEKFLAAGVHTFTLPVTEEITRLPQAQPKPAGPWAPPAPIKKKSYELSVALLKRKSE